MGGPVTVITGVRMTPSVTRGLGFVIVVITVVAVTLETCKCGHSYESVVGIAVVGGLSGTSTLFSAAPTAHGTPIESLTGKSPTLGTPFGTPTVSSPLVVTTTKRPSNFESVFK